MGTKTIQAAENIRPARWLIAAYLSGLLLPIILTVLVVHPGVKLLLVLFGMPMILIGSYGVMAVRRVFLYPHAIADLTGHRLLLVFVVPPALYLLVVAGKFTLILIAFALSFL